jgi:hypothetical protein
LWLLYILTNNQAVTSHNVFFVLRLFCLILIAMFKIFSPLFLIALFSITGFCQTVVLNPIKDNTIYSEFSNRSNGAGANFFVGQTGAHASGAVRRGLLHFNFSSIPAGSVITSASLSITCNNVPPAGSAALNTVELHRSLASWGEGTSNGSGSGAIATVGDATWGCRFANGANGCTQAWATTGGDFSTIVSSTIAVTNAGIYTFVSSAALIADIQKWVDTPAVNFGWILIGNENTDYSARGFSSKESSATATKLTITYSAAPCTTNTWTGAVSTVWETAGNWSCNSVPDGTSNVIINSGTVVLNSNRTVKTLAVNPGVNFKVNPGFNLTILQ